MSINLLEQRILGTDESLIPQRQDSNEQLFRRGLIFCWKPINPFLDGGLEMDLGKSTPNTAVIKDRTNPPLQDNYFHHDRGLGRMETVIRPLTPFGPPSDPGIKPMENPFLPKPKPPQY